MALMKEVQIIIDDYADNFLSLSDRWEDEKGYEDFKDYETALKTHFDNMGTRFIFKEATSDPFKVIFHDVIGNEIHMKAVPTGIETTIKMEKSENDLKSNG